MKIQMLTYLSVPKHISLQLCTIKFHIKIIKKLTCTNDLSRYIHSI